MKELLRKSFRKRQLRKAMPIGQDNVKTNLKVIGYSEVVCVKLARYQNDCGNVAL